MSKKSASSITDNGNGTFTVATEKQGDFVVETPLPDGVEPMEFDAWMALADSSDPEDRKVVNAHLRSLQYEPTAFIRLSKAERVNILIAHGMVGGADATGEEVEEKKPKAAKGKAKAAAPATKAPAKAAASGGGVDLSEVLAKMDELVAHMRDIQEAQAETANFVREIHAFNVIRLMNDDLYGDVEETGPSVYGQLVLGKDEG